MESHKFYKDIAKEVELIIKQKHRHIKIALLVAVSILIPFSLWYIFGVVVPINHTINNILNLIK